MDPTSEEKQEDQSKQKGSSEGPIGGLNNVFGRIGGLRGQFFNPVPKLAAPAIGILAELWIPILLIILGFSTFALVGFINPPPSGSNAQPSNQSPTGVPTITGDTTVRPTGSFKPDQASVDVDNAIRDAVATYNLPRWFFYAIIQRESSFNPNEYNPNRGYGLTQLTGSWYVGMPYPENLSAPNDDDQSYANDMNFKQYGKWILMSQVSPLTLPYDPKQNLDRFATGFAVPAFNTWKRFYNQSDAETLRMITFAWNKGVTVPYDPNDQNYLKLYDQYVAAFKRPVESQDGVWNGRPILPAAL